MTLQFKVAMVAVPLVLMAIVTACSVSMANRAADLARQAEADRVAVELERDGWRRSAEASSAELARVVPSLRAELERARAAGARPLVVSRAETGEAIWTGSELGLVCPPVFPGAADAGPVSSLESPPPPFVRLPGNTSELELGVRARVESALVADPRGRPFLETSVSAQLRAGDRVGAWRELPASEVEVAHAPELQRALDAYFGAGGRRRLSLMFGGAVGPDSSGLSAGVSASAHRVGWFVLGERARFGTGAPELRIHGGLTIALR